MVGNFFSSKGIAAENEERILLGIGWLVVLSNFFDPFLFVSKDGFVLWTYYVSNKCLITLVVHLFFDLVIN